MSLVAGPEQSEQQSQIIDEVLDEPSTSKLDGTIGNRLVTDTYTPAVQPSVSLVAGPEQAEQQSQIMDDNLFQFVPPVDDVGVEEDYTLEMVEEL